MRFFYLKNKWVGKSIPFVCSVCFVWFVICAGRCKGLLLSAFLKKTFFLRGSRVKQEREITLETDVWNTLSVRVDG